MRQPQRQYNTDQIPMHGNFLKKLLQEIPLIQEVFTLHSVHERFQHWNYFETASIESIKCIIEILKLFPFILEKKKRSFFSLQFQWNKTTKLMTEKNHFVGINFPYIKCLHKMQFKLWHHNNYVRFWLFFDIYSPQISVIF